MIFIQKTLKRQLEVFMAQFLFYYAPGDFRGAFWRELQFFFSHFQALNSRVQFSLETNGLTLIIDLGKRATTTNKIASINYYI